ncbi:PDZ domain, partial [Trinorchestia longiramus]
MSDSEPDNFSYQHHSSDDSSFGYDNAEWLEYVNADGSLLYIESYVSSTVREKQALVIRTSREKKNSSSNADAKIDPKRENHKKENKLLGLLRRRPSIRGKQEKLSLSVAPNPPAEEGRANDGGASKKMDGASPKRGGTSSERGGGSAGDKQRNQCKNRDASPAPKVTFRDNKSGELRTVPLHVVSVGDGRGGLCEAVLGVVAGRFSEPPTDRIMVAGLLPGSEAHTTHAIKIGDWLKAVNRKEVTWGNIDAVLGEVRVPSVVTLALQKCASETLSDQDHSNRK